MKIRTYLIILSVCLLGMTGVGLVQKSGYTNLNTESHPLDNAITAYFPDALLEQQMEQLNTATAETPIVLAVTCISEYYFRPGCATQKVSITHVFRGDGIHIGEEISVLACNLVMYDDYYKDKEILNMGYRNAMEPGKQYLVFLSRKLNNHNENDIIYLLPDEYLIAPIFGYEEKTDYPVTGGYDGSTNVEYASLKDNEFFFESQESIDKFSEFRKALMQQYPINN